MDDDWIALWHILVIHRMVGTMRRYVNLILAAVIVLFAGCTTQTDHPSIQQKSTTAEHVDVVSPAMAISDWRVGNGVVWDLEFAPDGDQLAQCVALGKLERQIDILSIPDGTELYSLNTLSPTAPAMCFSPDGNYFAVLGSDGLTVHSLSEQRVITSIGRTTFEPYIQSMGFSDDGQVIVGAAEFLDPDKKMIAWDARTGAMIPMPTGKVVWSGRGLSPDGSMFFDGGWPGPTPRIYKTDLTARITYCFRDKWPVDATFTPDSKNLATLHEDGLLVLWEIQDTGENARQLLSYRGFDGYRRFAISHDQQRIAAERGGVVRIWNLPMIANTP